MVDGQERSLLRHLGGMIAGTRRRRQALWHLPLGTLDIATVGKHYSFWHDWQAHDQPDDSWWTAGNHSNSVASVAAPNHPVGGWYDFMLPFLLKDYEALLTAGHQPYLTIGPWLHTDAAASMMGVREALIWLRAHLLGDRRGLREAPVRIFVMAQTYGATCRPFRQQGYSYSAGICRRGSASPPSSHPTHHRIATSSIHVTLRRA